MSNMHKKLAVIVASAGFMVPVLAQAGVEVYGQARMSVDFSSNDDAAAGYEDKAIAISSNASRLGFKGDEDLGGGLKAMWQFEQEVAFDTSTWGSKKRDAYVGLSGGFGTVLAGRINTPYKNSTQGMDIFVDTRGDYNGIISAVNSDKATFGGRFDNSIQYRSPDISGFKGAIAYSTRPGGSDELPLTTAASDQDAYSLSGSYTQGPLYLTAAYESLNAFTTVPGGTDDATAWKIGGAFTLGGATTIGAIWESADKGGTNNDRDAWYLNVAHKMDAITLKAALAVADKTGGVADTGATQFALGASYALSKTTEAYALYTMVSNDSAAKYTVEGVGGVTGKDVSSFSVGVNHTFSSK